MIAMNISERGRVLSQLQFRDGRLLRSVILGKSFRLQEPLFLFLQNGTKMTDFTLLSLITWKNVRKSDSMLYIINQY